MYEKILEISKKLNSKFLFDYDISRLTWFRAGGKTDIYCVISDENELEIILNNIGNTPFLVIGNGSNLLIRDGGFKGLIIKLGKSFNNLFIEKPSNEKFLIQKHVEKGYWGSIKIKSNVSSIVILGLEIEGYTKILLGYFYYDNHQIEFERYSTDEIDTEGTRDSYEIYNSVNYDTIWEG